MQTFDHLWRHGQAAQASLVHLAAYNAALVGTASLQALQMGLNTPQRFWGAMSRATGEPKR